MSNWTSENMMSYFDLLESYDDSFLIVDHDGTIESTAHWTNENNTDNLNKKDVHSTSSNRGKHGPLKTIYSGGGKLPIDPVAKAFIESSIAAGFPLAEKGFNEPTHGDANDDINGNNHNSRIGAGFYEFNIRNGLRDSVASALLGDENNGFRIPKNLIVQTDATVHKVIFETSSSSKPRAVGVEYTSGAKRGIFQARLKESSHEQHLSHSHEVILAAGAIMTPQILSNSGIRDGGLISDLRNVGKNLQDHPVVAVTFEDGDKFHEDVLEYLNYTSSGAQYYKSVESFNKNNPKMRNKQRQLGVLASPGFSAGAFLSSPWSDDGDPDIQLTVFPRTIEPHYSQQLMKNGQSETMDMLVTVALLRPEGRHIIRLAPFHEQNKEENLRDSIHFGFPTIETENQSTYLTDFDVKRLAWGIEQVRKIQNARPLSDRTGNEISPGSHEKEEKLREFIKSSAMTNSHWCGSTQMGTDTSNSVVDENLRVHGVKNLRVVDAGVMPFIPNGNTHSTTCAVALRGVDLILD